MAASRTVYQRSQSDNSLTLRHGVVTLSGYGIRVTVDRGHLLLEDGNGSVRGTIRLPRVRHGLKRLVIIGSDGFVSLAALRWLADQQAAFIMLERDGKVLAVTGPVRPSDARLRRAQGIAVQSGTALNIARELIDQKLAGQEQVARYKLHASEIADAICRWRGELPNASTPARILHIEGRAANSYWSAWRQLSINFPKKDEQRLPDHWRVFGTRFSPLTGSPRLAVNPPNAILNYLYAILESESRIAVSAVGLDPGLGVLHVDTPNRDSLALDVMEAVRPSVDAYLLEWLTKERLRREWFFEQYNGNCRLMGSFAAFLSETAPAWGRTVGVFAEMVAQRLWDSTRRSNRDRPFPTRLTQKRRSEGRGNEFVFKSPRARRPEKICPGCGVTTSRGQLCMECWHGISRSNLIELAKVGRIAALNPESRKKHANTQRRHQAAKRAWLDSPRSSWPTEKSYAEEIQPRLSGIAISRLSAAMGVSESYAADIRTGRHRPHPRHWQALAQLVGVAPE
jgi:CRISPR-associated endonuclease Cas1